MFSLLAGRGGGILSYEINHIRKREVAGGEETNDDDERERI